MVRFTSIRIRTTVSHGVRDRTARRSACRYEFVPLLGRTRSYSTRSAGTMECSSTNVRIAPFPYAIEIVHHEGVQAGASLYHKILGRTRSYSTGSVGTMECSNTCLLRVLFPYAIEIVQHDRVHARVVPQYTRAYAVVQHEKCRHDEVQQYKYTESTVPVRDRTALQGRFAAGRFGGPPLRS